MARMARPKGRAEKTREMIRLENVAIVTAEITLDNMRCGEVPTSPTKVAQLNRYIERQRALVGKLELQAAELDALAATLRAGEAPCR